MDGTRRETTSWVKKKNCQKGKQNSQLKRHCCFSPAVEPTCCDHQVEPHGRCSEWVGLRLASSSLGERWPALDCIPGGRGIAKGGLRGHGGGGQGDNLGVSGFWSNLKGGPVHVHPRSVVVAEPLQILLCVCSQDCALQLSVYCGIAEKRKIEQIVRI